MEAQAQPHTLHVSLQWDPTTDRFTLVHSVLLERALLPPGQWDLHFDEEGFGFVESHSSDDKNESLWVNDLFRRCLYKTDGGREVVLQSTAAGGEHAVSTFLSEQLLDFRSCVVRVPMGNTTGLEEVACNVRRPFLSNAGKGIFVVDVIPFCLSNVCTCLVFLSASQASSTELKHAPLPWYASNQCPCV